MSRYRKEQKTKENGNNTRYNSRYLEQYGTIAEQISTSTPGMSIARVRGSIPTRAHSHAQAYSKVYCKPL